MVRHNINGAPPDGHPRQCQAKMKRHGGRQCKKWALKGSDYCAFHGGRINKGRGIVRIDHLPFFYSSKLKGTLKKAVETMLDASPEQQLSLFEELAMMRAMAGNAVELYGMAEESGNKDQQALASELMRQALREVVQTCEAASRVANAGKDKISVHDIQFVINQIVRIAYEAMDEETAQTFEAMIAAEVKIPGTVGAEGTTITPDQDVQDMDATVPAQ